MKRIFVALGILAALPTLAQLKATVTLDNQSATNVIHKEIYGQFAEHLGSCIYGGIWVGPDSPIPNTNGYRNDVLNALRELKVPVMRWPGGCFADEYHWTDGIGPKENRPVMVNNNWGGTVEDNSFGTHEFLNLCELLGCEPYISGNVGSGTVEEMAKWVEYMTSESGSPMAKLRKENGREKPWHVKFLGVGNESWGCGGSMRPEYYADLFRRYSTYCREYDGNKLYKIASGASDYDYDWTEVLMKQVGTRMSGVSLHYYTVKGWDGSKGSATKFTNDEYYWTLGKALEIEPVIKKHIAIMDKYDPEKKVGLLVDEWGTWWDVEPGTNPGHLFQQNTMRDAFVASLSLDIFHKYTDRISMTNIAQVVNVLQSMILTKGEKMALTPTYFVFKMYNVHQNATYIPAKVQCDRMIADGDRIVPYLSVTASKDADGVLHISLSNTSLDKSEEVTVNLNGIKAKGVKGCILTADCIDDFNSFDNPDMVSVKNFNGAKLSSDRLVVTLPKMSVVTLELK